MRLDGEIDGTMSIRGTRSMTSAHTEPLLERYTYGRTVPEA